MKRLLTYLFLVIGLGLVVNSNVDAEVVEVCEQRSPNGDSFIKYFSNIEQYENRAHSFTELEQLVWNTLNTCSVVIKSKNKKLYDKIYKKNKRWAYAGTNRGSYFTHYIKNETFKKIYNKYPKSVIITGKEKTQQIAKKEPTQTQQVVKSALPECKGNDKNISKYSRKYLKKVRKWTNCHGTVIARKDGEKYVGEWKDGGPHGQGTWIHPPSGLKYVGEFKDDIRHGQGTFTWTSGEFAGDKYVGEFKDDKANGQGTYTHTNGDKYVGEYKDGEPQGQGRYIYADGTIDNGIWENGKLVKRNKIQTQIAKKEPKEEKKVVKKEPITKVKPYKKVVKLNKLSTNKTGSSEIKKDISTTKRKPGCDKLKIKEFIKICYGLNKGKEEIKREDVLALGTYQEFNSYPEEMSKQFGQGCKHMTCKSKKAGQKVYKLFVQHGPSYHERHPGAIIQGMAWFEIMYLGKLKENRKAIERYLKKGSDKKTNPLKKILTSGGNNKLRSLIKMNKGRKKMREALGLSLNDDLAKVLKREWLLGDFLNNDKLKVKKVKLDPSVKKRKKLLTKYQSAIKKYKEKLAEERDEG
jgi:hypothetical protein